MILLKSRGLEEEWGESQKGGVGVARFQTYALILEMEEMSLLLAGDKRDKIMNWYTENEEFSSWVKGHHRHIN